MLDSFRNIAKTWFGKLLGAFLIVGLAGFGISNVIFDIGTNTVARVGDEDITTREFQRAYNSQLSQFSQQVGQALTPQQALAMGIPSLVLDQLASQAAINQLGVKMGVGVSDDRLTKMLQEDPSFAGTLGKFDPTTFTRVLQQNGYTEAEYLELQTKAARRQQLVSGLLAGTAAPEAAKLLVARYTDDTRTLDYFVVNAQSIPPVAAPSEEELTAYLKDHQAEFKTQETRTVDLLTLSAEALAATRTVTDEEIAAEYERTKESRVRIERRQIQQVPFATTMQADWFERGKAAGKSLDELLKETGLALTDLGTLSKAEVTDPTLADAAFGLAQGDFAIIPGVSGKRAVTVTAIEPGGQIALDEVREEIRKGLALSQARNELVDILDQIEELRAAFQPLTDIAGRFGLPMKTVTLTSAGAELADIADIAEENRGKVAAAIFSAEQGQLAPSISLGSNRNAWFDLKRVEPARDQTLEEVREAVTAAWTAEKTDAAVLAEIEKITTRLTAGEAFTDVAASFNLFPTLSPQLKRDGTTLVDGASSRDPVLDQSVAAAAFAGGGTHFGSARNGDGDYIVFQVLEVNAAGVGEDQAQIASYLEEGNRQSLYSAFVAGLVSEVGIRPNRQVLDQLISLDTATGQ